MSKFCCITDLIRFMMKESEKLMKGTVHEDNLFIIHDALLLMTLKKIITWMKENKYFHRWLLTMNGLQDGTPYDGRPVGNIPKFMPLDHILNRDILYILRFHCVLSCFVLDEGGTNKEDGNMRFGLSTPKEIARALKRIWESKIVIPSSLRIIQDVDLAFKAL